ncbi:MAG: cytochrome C, partial [Planctomycetota bacterium]
KNLSMAWCIDCHRNPEPHIRPSHLVTKLDWDGKVDPSTGRPAKTGEQLIDEKNINPQEHCAVCHR